MANISVPEMRKGDIIKMHGGVFELKEDARFIRTTEYGDCYVAKALTLSGYQGHYFYPGSEWTFQGNHRSAFWKQD